MTELKAKRCCVEITQVGAKNSVQKHHLKSKDGGRAIRNSLNSFPSLPNTNIIIYQI